MCGNAMKIRFVYSYKYSLYKKANKKTSIYINNIILSVFNPNPQNNLSRASTVCKIFIALFTLSY